ncbi:MAG: hypothetical protein K6253_00845 [Candidatus Liberibacter asiaticus]|nr:hypothetical protein [Candidatus Liberibacter asiaticus]
MKWLASARASSKWPKFGFVLVIQFAFYGQAQPALLATKTPGERCN